MKSKSLIWVMAEVFLLCLFIAIGPVSAAGTVIEQGATVFIGEGSLDVTHALNNAQGSPLNGIPPITTIGWWASPWDVGITSPTREIDIGPSYKNLFIGPPVFIDSEGYGYLGNWYVVDMSHQAVGNPVFTVAGTVIEQGATVFIGEGGLDVTHALNNAQGSPLNGIPPIRTIGWWASLWDVGITSPNREIDIGPSYQNLFIGPPVFVDNEGFRYLGNWYVVDMSHQAVGNPVFIAAAPITNVPTTVKIVPKIINLGSKGYFLAFVTLPELYKGSTIDINTVSCSGAPAVRMMNLKIFPRVVGFVFRTNEVKGLEVGKKVSLNVKGKLKNQEIMYTFSGSDTVRVIRKPGWQPEDIKDVSKFSDNQLFKKYST
jgi:hypothetical protein